MLARRVIACLDVRGERVVKGVGFEGLRDLGDPAQVAARHEAGGADEIVLLDVSASREERSTLLPVVEAVARVLSIPLTVGGGVRGPEDVALLLRAGADKVALNSAAVERPGALSACAAAFGSQCVVASVDARSESSGHRVWIRGGSRPTGLDAIDWAVRCSELGAGEILLTSIDRDGTGAGYDLALTSAVAARVRVPVIASGGAGCPADVARVLDEGGADAALVAGRIHTGRMALSAIKAEVAARGLPVRRT